VKLINREMLYNELSAVFSDTEADWDRRADFNTWIQGRDNNLSLKNIS
jgi:hypothetical protein